MTSALQPAPAAVAAARHSATWGLKLVLGDSGHAFSEAMLFGLGTFAWFCWDRRSRTLTGLHPNGIHRALLALNVTTMMFRHLDAGALRLVADRAAEGQPTLLTVPRARAVGAHGHHHVAAESTLVVTGFSGSMDHRESATVEYLRPLGRDKERTSAPAFMEHWLGEHEGHRCARWFIPLFTTLRVDRRFVVRRALWLFVEQMRARFSSLGACGMAGLEALTAELASKSGVDPRLDSLREDGGAFFYRDLVGDFLHAAANELDCDALRTPADRFQQSGLLWAQLLQHPEPFGRSHRHVAVARLRAIAVLETKAIDDIRRRLDERPVVS
jgi:hypothetical protein